MAEVIRDGTGKGYLVKVNEDNQMLTSAVTSGVEIEANENGDAYNINTGLVSLTDAVDTPLLYLKNNEDNEFIISVVVIGMFNSAGGDSTADVYSTFIRNPTLGTIISDAVAVPIISNRNYGSNKVLDADVFLGATGRTMTNGDDHILVRMSVNSRTFVPINEVLPKGTSIGIKIKPPTSNTAMTAYVAIIGYIHD